MYYIYSVVYFLSTVVIAAGVVNPYGPTVVAEYTNCITSLINKTFDNPGLVLVSNTFNTTTSVFRIREDIIKYLNDRTDFTVQIISAEEVNEDCEDLTECNELPMIRLEFFTIIPLANYYVLVVDGFTEFRRIIDKVVTLRTWNPRAYFVILCFKVENIHVLIAKRYPERMISYLFKRNAINAIVVIPDQDNYRNGVVYGWRPYDPPAFCGYHNETANDRVIIENVCQRGVLISENKLFQNRVPINQTGCYLDIIALERQPFISSDPNDPNLEKMLIEELADLFHLKTKYELINDFRGEKNEHGVWSGALTEIVNGRGDILFGGIFPDYDVHEDFDSSIPYLADSYTWIVPRAYKSPPWVALMIIFDKLVWLSAAATFFLCVFVWKFIAMLSNDGNRHKCFAHCFLNTWYTALGFASYMQPIRQSLRVFFIFLNIYCVLFLTAYQTKLIDVLTHPSFETQIETVDQLIRSDLKIGGAEELHDLFKNSTDPDDFLIGEMWIDVVDAEEAILDVVVHRNFSFLCSRLEIQYLSAVMPELSDSFGNPTYYEFKAEVFTVPLEIVALRGFPFLHRFNLHLSIFQQMGVVERLKRIFTNVVSIRRANLLKSGNNEHNSLSLLHLEGGFLALVMGYVSGIVVLIFEIIWFSQYPQRVFLMFLIYTKRLRNKNFK